MFMFNNSLLHIHTSLLITQKFKTDIYKIFFDSLFYK